MEGSWIILLPLLAFIGWASFEIWKMLSALDRHSEEERRRKRLLRPVHGTKEEIEEGLKTGEYIIVGTEIHLTEAHFPTRGDEDDA